jgi:nucleoside 2-deoxyribosyltransferase
VGTVVNCSRCGDFQIDHVVADDYPLPFTDDKQKALASYLVRKMQREGRATLNREFFASLHQQSLPTPAELCDNLLLWLSEQADGRVGKIIGTNNTLSDLDVLAKVGAIDAGDAQWAANALTNKGLITFQPLTGYGFRGQITPSGWNWIEELRRAHVASRDAFFARKFTNPDLDVLYETCLKQAVAETGFELRTVTQKAGHIDAIIEDEIRRCRFLVADLSDGNAGAYWEAGLAEGLGKPVIYICRDKIETHFDTDHRQTVRWDLNKLSETATRLKAVIRNTLLGDAKQDD